MSIFDEVSARYPGVFADRPRPEPDLYCDHRDQFRQLHQHIDNAAALQHRHLLHVEGTIMAALDDLRAEAQEYARTVADVAIPAFDQLMAAVVANSGGASEAELAEVSAVIAGANDQLLAKANEAAAAVGGEG